MSYENAPAARLLATHCALCGRVLLDAVSVEAAVGPDCRKKHGYYEAQEEPDWTLATRALGRLNRELLDGKGPREQVNVLIQDVATERDRFTACVLTEAIAAVGFVQVAKRIARRFGCVEIIADERLLRVRFDHEIVSPELIAALRGVRGRKWDPDSLENMIPASSRFGLWHALRRVLPPGTLVVGTSVACI